MIPAHTHTTQHTRTHTHMQTDREESHGIRWIQKTCYGNLFLSFSLFAEEEFLSNQNSLLASFFPRERERERETQQTIQKLRSDKRQRLRMEQRDERREEWGERGKRASIAGIMASFPIDSRQSRRNIIRKRQHNDNC